MSADNSRILPLGLAVSAGGLLVSQLFDNLTKATPATSLWLLFSKYRRYAGWIEAQARHESNNYQSDVFIRSNNPFGMKNAYKRKQLGKQVEGDPYRHYESIGEAIRDYLLYLDFVNFPRNITTIDSFAMALKDRGYFEDNETNYINGLKFWQV